MEQLGKLKSLLSKQEKEKVQILAVSVDTHEESKKFGEMLSKRFDGEFDFPLLEDKDHKVINRYGVFNPDGAIVFTARADSLHKTLASTGLWMPSRGSKIS